MYKNSHQYGPLPTDSITSEEQAIIVDYKATHDDDGFAKNHDYAYEKYRTLMAKALNDPCDQRFTNAVLNRSSGRQDLPLMQRALECGASPDIKSGGAPIIEQADSLDIVQLLVKYNVSMQARDYSTVLHAACNAKCPANILKFYLNNAGVDVNYRKENNGSPINSWARSSLGIVMSLYHCFKPSSLRTELQNNWARLKTPYLPDAEKKLVLLFLAGADVAYEPKYGKSPLGYLQKEIKDAEIVRYKTSVAQKDSENNITELAEDHPTEFVEYRHLDLEQISKIIKAYAKLAEHLVALITLQKHKNDLPDTYATLTNHLKQCVNKEQIDDVQETLEQIKNTPSLKDEFSSAYTGFLCSLSQDTNNIQ
jgi:hypothetical protein